MPDRICSVEDCERTHRARGYCVKHYYVLRPQVCTIEGCDRPYRAKGMCVMHYRRLGKGGTCANCDAAFSGDTRKQFCSEACRRALELARTVDYAGAHRRLRMELGDAKNHPCADCGAPAAHWSYNNTDPNELTGSRGSGLGLPYSLNSAHYSARCPSCHKRFDMAYSA